MLGFGKICLSPTHWAKLEALSRSLPCQFESHESCSCPVMLWGHYFLGPCICRVASTSFVHRVLTKKPQSCLAGIKKQELWDSQVLCFHCSLFNSIAPRSWNLNISTFLRHTEIYKEIVGCLVTCLHAFRSLLAPAPAPFISPQAQPLENLVPTVAVFHCKQEKIVLMMFFKANVNICGLICCVELVFFTFIKNLCSGNVE